MSSFVLSSANALLFTVCTLLKQKMMTFMELFDCGVVMPLSGAVLRLRETDLFVFLEINVLGA